MQLPKLKLNHFHFPKQVKTLKIVANKMFRYPRNCLLNFASEFLTKCSVKLNEINKKSAQEKNLELLDQKCFIKLNEVQLSLLS